MRQQQFEAEQAALWAEYRDLLTRLEAGPRRGGRLPPEVPIERLPRQLRVISGHYALARSRGYSPGLVEDLHQMVRRGYRQLYRFRPDWPRRLRDFALADFPRVLRRHLGAFWLAAALFFGPMLAMGLACAKDPALIYSLIEAEQVAELESMYDPSNRRLGRSNERQADDDVAMFGFYVKNNVGIAFRTFAAGLLFGVGSLFLLGFNGLYIGAAAGHLTGQGMGVPFWSFVSGHSAFELTAIAIAGAAGLVLARALLMPGQQTRLAALRGVAVEAVQLALGAMLLLVLAAVIEGFWSGNTGIPPGLKHLVGGLGWVLVAAYLGLAGRREEPAPQAHPGGGDGP